MLTNIYGAKCVGIEAVPVTVEVDITAGLGIHLVGLADAAVKESLLRTITALQSMGFKIPGRKIVINLAPADMHKKGSGYDVPIALGIIAASGQKEMPLIGRYIIMGELGLDGSIRDIPGALPIAELASKKGFAGCILPLESADGATEYSNTEIYGVRNLSEAISILSGEKDSRSLLRLFSSVNCLSHTDAGKSSRGRLHKGLSTHRNRQYDGFFGHHRTGRSQARPGNSSSRRTQRDNDRTSRRREEFTGQGYGGHSASYGTGRGSSDKQNLFCRRQGMAKARTQQTQTIQVTSLQRVGSRASRRRFGQYTSGRNIPCAQWGPVP